MMVKAILTFFIATYTFTSFAYDEEYSLKSVALLPVVDNMGGAEARKIERDIEVFLERHSRWTMKPSGQQRFSLIEEKSEDTTDQELLIEFGKSTGADGLYRVILKRTPKNVEGAVHLINSKNGLTVSSREFQVSQETGARKKNKNPELGPATKLVTETIIHEIQLLESGYHFDGEISGRSGVDVTLAGLSYDIRVDDILNVVRIEKVEIHPLLKNVTSVETFPVGEVRITEVGTKTAYGRILSENKAAVKNGYKLKRTNRLSPYKSVPSERQSAKTTSDIRKDSIERTPMFGRVRFGVLFGKQTRRATSSTGVKRGTFSGNPFGALAEGELWVTKKIIAQMMLGLGTMSGDMDSGGSKSMTSNDFALLGGYRFLPLGYFLGPKLDLKLGYIRQSFSTDPDATEEYGGGAFGGIALGFSGSIPITTKIGLEGGLLLAPAAGYTADTGATAGESASVMIFNFYGTYSVTSSYSAFGGIRVATSKADIGASGEVQYSQVLFNGGIQFAF